MGLIEMAVLDDSYSLNEQYFNNDSYIGWLESFTIDERQSDSQGRSYKKLLRALWDIEFVGIFGNDSDRGEEGLELRSRYRDILDKMAGEGEFYTPDVRDIFGECRVLEMLIALCMHMYTLMEDMDIYNSVSRWFWEILRNVSLDLFDDIWFDRLGGIAEVEYIVTEIINLRSTECNGWFNDPRWKTTEIWYQMHWYLKRYFE